MLDQISTSCGTQPRDKAYQLGFNQEKHTQSCSQSTVAAINNAVVKASTSLCGGSAIQMLGTCSALAGGIVVLDCFFGRQVEKMSHEGVVQANLDALFSVAEVSGLLADKFIKRYVPSFVVTYSARFLGESTGQGMKRR